MIFKTPAAWGQDKITEFFSKSLEDDRIPHALILSGQRGSGKFEIALEYVLSALNTENKGHPDIKIIDLFPPKTKYIEVIREELISNVILEPFSAKRKFYIVKGAGLMPPQAQNALLKTFEEPPEYASIILLTEDAKKLLPTIRSRAVTLFMQPLETEKVAEYLENQNIDSGTAKASAELSFGWINKAMEIVSDESYMDMAYSAGRIISEVAYSGNYTKYTEEIQEFVNDFENFLELMEIFIRDVLIYTIKGNTEGLFGGWKKEIIKTAEVATLDRLGRVSARIVSTRRAMEANGDNDVLMRLLLCELGGRIETTGRSAV